VNDRDLAAFRRFHQFPVSSGVDVRNGGWTCERETHFFGNFQIITATGL
jgi:hypothetical protein